ncbi:MAG: Uma2 family endonuclease [Chloroflexota bacterium]|nr:Uma2 family endonuclease [Chloroflexota bacterium]
MSIPRRYTSADLERLPDVEGTRYEIIDGELHVSRQPHWEHQYACHRAAYALEAWHEQSGAGVVIPAPGLIFAEDQDVAPDVVWISRERLAQAKDEAGHLRAAPELVVEVLSPGAANERRDREVKLALYSRQGVEEYWIVDWRARTVQVYRRAEETLRPVATLGSGDVLTSPLLPGITCPVSSLWASPG